MNSKQMLKEIEKITCELSVAIQELSRGCIKPEWCRWIVKRNAPIIYVYGYGERTLEAYAKAVVIDFIRTNMPDVPDKHQTYGPNLEMEYKNRKKKEEQEQRKAGKK